MSNSGLWSNFIWPVRKFHIYIINGSLVHTTNPIIHFNSYSTVMTNTSTSAMPHLLLSHWCTPPLSFCFFQYAGFSIYLIKTMLSLVSSINVNLDVTDTLSLLEQIYSNSGSCDVAMQKAMSPMLVQTKIPQLLDVLPLGLVLTLIHYASPRGWNLMTLSPWLFF